MISVEVPPLLDRFDAAVAALREKYDPLGPGFCVGLAVEGQTVRTAHHGLAHLEWPQPLAGDTRFYLASESKFWVAALVMQAVAAGRITLDADMRALLPALASYEHPVLLGHLLRHTSGVDDYLYLWQMQLGHVESDLITQAQALALVQRAEDGDFEPGSRFDYSNSNYVLLADWLERDAGLPLNEIARQGLFEPWQLRDTSFENDPQRVLPRRARSYQTSAAGAWRELPVNLASWGDGGLWSTLDDLLRAEACLQDDWQRHGGQSLLARCAADDLRFSTTESPYRFGTEVLRKDQRQLLFHGGGFAAFSSLALRCPDEAWALVVLANIEGFDASAETWADCLWPGAAIDMAQCANVGAAR
ncbi:serine hydrolase domain-containing protein [Roseateles sp.]|uniref:serine hydrolase domain-containing protein n=1 Tax=Roseateles sp. TaxID=1971397 RepID=UPI00391C3FA2